MASCLHLRVFCFGNIVILTVQLVTTYYIYIYIIGIQQNFGMQQNWAIVPSCSTGLRFLKTADIIEKDPWDLHKGAKCLRDWLDP